ncbi:uncharacterized protein LOC129976567 [Argiope bruennichi]|uniref:uncharacterized protein LOC129976567 n=1 Tax=Argiope bruennichi TaxID=94029 RepID=UPI00249434EC|nr:uncharacterized protein LOC129976567 [Argiope bruennichi]
MPSIVLRGAFFLFLLTIATAEGTCKGDSLPCDDGQCVRKEDWCDGKEACEDGSDEAYCEERAWWGKSPNKCDKKIHFRCDDGLCWPLAAHCNGNADCKDASDEKNCDSKAKVPDESDKKIEDSDEIEENSEEKKDKSEEEKSKDISGEEKKDKSEEEKSEDISEEEKEESKESSEEIGSDKVTRTTENPSTTPTPGGYNDYEEYEDVTTEAALQKTTIADVPPPRPFYEIPSIEELPLEVSPEVPFWSPTTEMDFYAKKMGQNEVKQQYTTRINAFSTSTFRPPPARTIAQYPTRPYRNQHPSNRKPAVPYTGPTKAYTPRPYRYIGKQNSGQAPPLYRGRYPVSHSSNNHRLPHHSPDYNYISSQLGTNYHQQYPNFNNNNGRSDWRNGVTRPQRVYGRQLRAPAQFYFKKNYNEIYGRANYESVRRGAEWIRSIQNATGGWGKETPRALVALSLVNNSFLAGSHEKDLMQKYFQVYLGVNLLRDEPVSLNRLAMLTNALIATCLDPRDFHGWDLTELIRNSMLKLHRASRPPVINPLVYLSLCLADRNLTNYEVHHLMTYLVATRNDETTRDMMYLALQAFACHMQKESYNVAHYYSLQKMVWNATSKILQRMKEDGSFGSVYSTAIAAQALMSVNDTVQWNPEQTFRFLKSQQQRNGSFGDFLATYHVLPALSGRSLLHLRNTECNPPRVDRELSPQEILEYPGPKSYIRYSLHMGSPLATGYTVQVLVPNGISFFDVMRVAAYENNQFKFSYEEVNGKINVFSISDLPNDPEEGLAWRLYVRAPSDTGNIPNIQQLYTGDIREFHPTPDQHVIFWYHPLGF